MTFYFLLFVFFCGAVLSGARFSVNKLIGLRCHVLDKQTV